ncbi:uncharacterized protein K452DRAFT_290225 [Aplosporella prunicola CBS 121167]|uniref:Inositol polyphosphate-related phosphatase domain-containing protein n=1 Tax=Aplosporella prunicola CBS 121167 TaxID=1176127 RepID=A0A6A6B895_9PEZI|nr:uncharacterized protein K452DRAFT_290225 [Aplosporella prunicola CBS 121167]KAF2139127.1 hypothetical protein K452DRAFT_290225 [Aplosporella prunicola CBS 121167]
MTSPVQSSLQLYLLSFNCARNLIDPHRLARHLFDALPLRHDGPGASSADPLPDVIVVSLQELAGIAPAFLAGSLLAPYFDRFVAALRFAAPDVYRHVLHKSLGMTAIMLFAKPHVADRIVSIETAGVGLGFWEMGNKGAVAVRIGLASPQQQQQNPAAADEVLELTFVAAHLAPMEYGVARRNDDWANIVRRLVFEPEGGGKGAIPAAAAADSEQDQDQEREQRDDGAGQALLPQSPTPQQGLYTPNAHVFFFGDLNYRTSDTPPQPIDTLTRFPRPGDPYAALLATDQLQRERRAGRALHGFEEANIDFPPTYKYAFHPPRAWAPHRWPSWCDRILFLPASGLSPQRYDALPLLPSSDHQPVALAVEVAWKALEGERRAETGREGEADTASPSSPPLNTPSARDAPFPLDPSWRSRRRAARSRELVVGVLAAAVLTWQGRMALLALVLAVWFAGVGVGGGGR